MSKKIQIFTILSLFSLVISMPPLANAQTTVIAKLVNTIDASIFGPPALNPAPDPAGIAFLSNTNHLMISDSEVNEMTIYKGSNLFQITLSGEMVKAANTLSFSHEPTGVAFNPDNGHYYFTDDDTQRIYDLNSGADGLIGTDDDQVKSINIGDTDLEGICYWQNTLFIAGGDHHEVFQINLSGSIINRFDVASLGLSDIEGVAINSDSQTLFILDQPRKKVVETTLNGTFLKMIDISAAHAVLPGDIAWAPTSDQNDNPKSFNLYLVDRGIDNNADPNENDGRIYEMSLQTSLPTSSPSPTPQPCPADLNGDRQVNYEDFRQVLGLWGYNISGPEDLKTDYKINALDLVVVIKDWGDCQ